jgi:titin
MKYLTGYIVMFKGQNDSEFTTVSVPVGDYSINPYILNNLVNGNSYQIKLLAVNEIGTSSPILSNGTPLLIPNSPSNLTGSSGNSFVDLNWDNSLSNGVTSHIIEYRLQGSTLWSSINTNSALTSYRVNSLSSSTNYEFRVYSINPYGSSVASNTVTILTQSSINTITLLTPVVNSGNVSLTWSTPNSVLTSQQLTGFLVEYKISTDSIWSQIATTGVTQQYTFTSLNPGSTYNFRVSAVLSSGLSSLSTVSNTVSATLNQIPNRVNNLVVSASGSSAILSWSAPTGFVSGTSYNVYYKTSSSNSYSLFANTLNLSTTVTGLSSNVNYNFMVKSLLSGVESEGSIVSSTIYNTPSGVNSLTLQRFISSPQSVTLSWLEPTDNGGSNVTSYRVEYKKNSDANYTVFLSNLLTNQVTISSLESGILYDFRVTAITIAGAGASSSIQGTPYGVAKAPTSLGLTPSYNSVLVNYVPPTNTGGTAIINYNVYYRVVGSSNYTLASSLVTGNSYTITGLSTSSNYEVKITAQNAVGEGESITNTTTTLTASVPSAITNLILAPANTLIAVSWSQPASSNGSAILGYRVKVLDLDTPGAVESVVDRGLNLAYTVTGLTNGINYQVTVTAYNSVGESPSVSLTEIPN